jgi:transposase-like protein
VIDGSKALRAAINAVFGSASLVQRCRQHKLRNVAERLPKDQQDQTKSLMRVAWKLDVKEGIAKLEKLAKWLEREHPKSGLVGQALSPTSHFSSSGSNENAGLWRPIPLFFES